jgi:acetolactate synthase-1/3 small subunit
VADVSDHSPGAPSNARRREVLVRRARTSDVPEIKRLVDIFRGKVVDVTDKTYTLEITGDGAKLDALIGALDAALILETVRTGTCGIGRGERILKL